jgi:hypothetical protein
MTIVMHNAIHFSLKMGLGQAFAQNGYHFDLNDQLAIFNNQFSIPFWSLRIEHCSVIQRAELPTFNVQHPTSNLCLGRLPALGLQFWKLDVDCSKFRPQIKAGAESGMFASQSSGMPALRPGGLTGFPVNLRAIRAPWR